MEKCFPVFLLQGPGTNIYDYYQLKCASLSLLAPPPTLFLSVGGVKNACAHK